MTNIVLSAKKRAFIVGVSEGNETEMKFRGTISTSVTRKTNLFFFLLVSCISYRKRYFVQGCHLIVICYIFVPIFHKISGFNIRDPVIVST